jgi:hypothetical protein
MSGCPLRTELGPSEANFYDGYYKYLPTGLQLVDLGYNDSIRPMVAVSTR